MKRLFALVLSLALMVAVFAGCHEKGEIAVTIGGNEFTSGYYACALVYADTEARNRVLEENMSEDGTMPADFEYWDYDLDKTDYVEWVKNRAVDNLKQIAAVIEICEQKKISLTEDELKDIETNVDSQWREASVYMEKNGIAKETYLKYQKDVYLMEKYFEALYGKDGEMAISDEDISKQLSENYMLVNVLYASYSNLAESDKKETREKYVAYEKALNDGSKTFEQIYLEDSGQTAEEHKHEEPEEGEAAPQDYHATIISEDSSEPLASCYEPAKKLKTGEVELITLDDSAGLVLIVKKDILADPYYIETYDMGLRQELKYEDFAEGLIEYAKKLDCDISSFSTKQFDVKKIAYS